MRIIHSMIANARKHPAKGWVWVYSPTRALIMTYGGEGADEGARSIRRWNTGSLLGSTALAILLYWINLSVDLRLLAHNYWGLICLVLWLWPGSRIIEICKGFYDDALQIMSK